MIDNPGEVKTFVIHSKGSIIGTKEILREPDTMFMDALARCVVET